MMEKEINHFFKNIMYRLGYYGWSLRIVPNSIEGFCWSGNKIINIGVDQKNWKSLLLHEIAHIDTCRFCNNKHHIEFWRRYEDLMNRFLPAEEVDSRYNDDVGFFGKCYDYKPYNYLILN